MSGNRPRTSGAFALGAFLAAFAVGCGSSTDADSNLSPTAAQQDPAQLERAQKEAEEAKRKQEALDKKLFRKAPNPESGS